MTVKEGSRRNRSGDGRMAPRHGFLTRYESARLDLRRYHKEVRSGTVRARARGRTGLSDYPMFLSRGLMGSWYAMYSRPRQWNRALLPHDIPAPGRWARTAGRTKSRSKLPAWGGARPTGVHSRHRAHAKKHSRSGSILRRVQADQICDVAGNIITAGQVIYEHPRRCSSG